jgi:uncharacterized protein YegP (UPF0339 family)
MAHIDHFLVFKGTDGQWYWRFVAGNGREIFRSSEGYWNKEHCLHSIEIAKASEKAIVIDPT